MTATITPAADPIALRLKAFATAMLDIHPAHSDCTPGACMCPEKAFRAGIAAAWLAYPAERDHSLGDEGRMAHRATPGQLWERLADAQHPIRNEAYTVRLIDATLNAYIRVGARERYNVHGVMVGERFAIRYGVRGPAVMVGGEYTAPHRSGGILRPVK